MHFVVIQGRGTRPSQKNIWNMQNIQLDSPCNPSPPVIFKPNGNTKKVIWMVCWTFLVGEHLVLSIVLCRKFRPKWSPMKNPSGAMETEGFLLCKDGWFSFQTIFFCKIPLCGTLSAPPTHGNSNSKVPWEMGRFVVVTISAASRTPATVFFKE